MHGLLRSIIREVLEELEEEELDEFSGVAAIGGGPATPLGTDAYYPNSRVGKGKKKVDEANTVSIAGSGFPSYIDVNGDGVADEISGKLMRSQEQAYLDSVELLARSFGGAESPFPNIRHARKHMARKY
jgi:hypothetical protein